MKYVYQTRNTHVVIDVKEPTWSPNVKYLLMAVKASLPFAKNV